MRISQLVNPEFIVPTYLTGQALHIMGAPGGGKSDITRLEFPRVLSAALGEEFGVVVLDGPGLDAPDVQGFCVPTKGEDGKLTSIITRSAHMPTTQFLEQFPRGVLVIEERNAADQLTQKALNQVVLERRFGKHYLPKGWMVVSLSNRVVDKSGASRPMMHSINREMTIDLAFNIEDHTVYWERTGMHPYGIAFAKQNVGAFALEVPSEPRPFCTARSYTFAWNWLTQAGLAQKLGTDDVVTSETAQAAVAGYIGEGASATLFAYLSVKDELPTIAEIISDPLNAKAPSVERLDAVYMVMQNCIHHVDGKNVDSIWQYIERLPKEIQTSAASSCIKKTGGALLNNKRLGKWITENRALVADTLA